MIYVRDEEGLVERIAREAIAKVEADAMQDNVNHPKHYELPNGIEVFDVISGSLSEEAVKGFCIGNVIKYVCRHDRKNGVEDLKKARWYLNRYIEIAEKNIEKN